ncbi:MAG: acyl carrier protein [Deinococcus sp.]
MDTFEQVKEVIVDKLGVDADKVVPDARFVEDLGADSLETVELIMGLEDKFSVSIADEDAEQIRTVQAAVDYVASKQEASRVGGGRGG